MSNTHSYIEDERNQSIYININGDLVKRNEAKISVFDSGFLLGDGVWEGIRLYNNQLVFKKEHLKRLFYGIKKLEIEMPITISELEKNIIKTIEANNIQWK